MKEGKRERGKKIPDLLLCAFFSGELLLGKYLYEVMRGDLYRSIRVTMLVFPIVTLSLFLLLHRIQTLRKPLAVITLTLLCGALLGAWICVDTKGTYEEMMVYQIPDTKRELYEGKKVLLLVPHQDDDINVLGGVIEEYTRYGSELTVVFSTNGDYYGQQDLRQQEARTVLTALGVEEKNIIFLGYGDGWLEKHIYHGQEGEILTSHIGKKETYGPGEAKAYKEGRAYTRENLKNDLKAVILEQDPDLVYCVDYDEKDDHRALSLLFEEVAGELLQSGGWHPIIMKGFAYETAWFAEKDYKESKNLTETKNPDDQPYMEDNHTYLWEERVRMPICAASLSRRLIDSRDIVGSNQQGDGTWIPDERDEKREVSLSFREPTDICRVVLYDNPSLEDNILNATILFSDGSSMETGALMKNGSGTEFLVKKENIESLTVKLESSEGEQAGLTEIEIYDQEKKEPFSILKVVDEKGNFVYDYLVDEVELSWGLYTWGINGENEQNAYEITTDNTKCSGSMENGTIRIHCPKGETCVLTVRHRESGITDSVRIRHLSDLKEYQVKKGAELYQMWKNNLAEQEIRYGGIREDGFWGSVLLMAYSNLRNPV